MGTNMETKWKTLWQPPAWQRRKKAQKWPGNGFSRSFSFSIFGPFLGLFAPVELGAKENAVELGENRGKLEVELRFKRSAGIEATTVYRASDLLSSGWSLSEGHKPPAESATLSEAIASQRVLRGLCGGLFEGSVTLPILVTLGKSWTFNLKEHWAYSTGRPQT